MIIDKARELGIALSETPEFQAMIQAQKLLEEDVAVSALMAELQNTKSEIIDMMTQEDADATLMQAGSSRMEEIKEQLLNSPVFKDAVKAQDEFQKLMDIVNREIGACIGVPMDDDDEACTGDCHRCGGCKH